MFTQNPHPIFLASLDNQYTITELTANDYHTKHFEWECKGHKLTVSVCENSLDIYDHVTTQNAIFYLPEFFPQHSFGMLKDHSSHAKESIDNDLSGVKYAVEKLLIELKESMNPKKLQTMQVMISKMVETYPGIKEFIFRPELPYGQYDKFSIVIEDEKGKVYKLECENTFNLTNNFYLVDGISFGQEVNLKGVSYHEILKKFKFEESLNINPIVKLLD